MASYCTVAEIDALGVNPSPLRDVPAVQKQQEVDAASDKIDGYLRGRYRLPLVSAGDDIKKCCARLATIGLHINRGVSAAEVEMLLRLRALEEEWLQSIAAGTLTPAVDDGSGGGDGSSAGGPRVVTSTGRGWSTRGTSNARGPFQSD